MRTYVRLTVSTSYSLIRPLSRKKFVEPAFFYGWGAIIMWGRFYRMSNNPEQSSFGRARQHRARTGIFSFIVMPDHDPASSGEHQVKILDPGSPLRFGRNDGNIIRNFGYNKIRTNSLVFLIPPLEKGGRGDLLSLP